METRKQAGDGKVPAVGDTVDIAKAEAIPTPSARQS